MNYSVTRFGAPLDKSLYTIDEKTRTFSSEEHGLVLDFNLVNGWKFQTSFNCTLKTGSDCSFVAGDNCFFRTGFGCVFDTDSDCIFKTGAYCTFNTSYECTFDAGYNCTFNTGYGCVFKAGPYGTFKVGSDCIISTNYFSTFETGPNCVVLRRDTEEVIELTEGTKKKLNTYGVRGYAIIK